MDLKFPDNVHPWYHIWQQMGQAQDNFYSLWMNERWKEWDAIFNKPRRWEMGHDTEQIRWFDAWLKQKYRLFLSGI